MSIDFSLADSKTVRTAPCEFEELNNFRWSERDDYQLCSLDLLEPIGKKVETEGELPPAEKTTSADVKAGFEKLIDSLGTASKNEISLAELQKAIGDPRIKGAEAQILAILKVRLDKFNELDPSSDPKEKRVTAAAIEKFHSLQKEVKEGKNKEQAAVDLVEDVDNLIKEMRKVVEGTVRKLYADEKQPLNNIKMECVKQGAIGNCYFYGAVGALLAVNPAAIKDLIKEEADGTYTVKFPGRKAINIQPPSDAEIFLFQKPGKDGTWMWALEKAYGQYCMNDTMCQQWRKLLGREQNFVPQENTEGPSLFDDGLKFLTGKSIEWTFNFDKDKMIGKLEELAAEMPRRPITADASFNVTVGKGAPVWGHTYSVINYDTKEGTIVLRNPWGSSPPENAKVKDLGDGKFEMSVHDFCKYFSRISYPRKK